MEKDTRFWIECKLDSIATASSGSVPPLGLIQTLQVACEVNKNAASIPSSGSTFLYDIYYRFITGSYVCFMLITSVYLIDIHVTGFHLRFTWSPVSRR